MQEELLKSYLRDNLIELSLKKYHDNSIAQGSLDGLSDLTSLQTLQIRPLHMADTWEVTSKLSQLTALRSFHFQRGVLTGSLIAALGSLPALTELKSSCIPGQIFAMTCSQFTSLRSFTKSSNALYDCVTRPLTFLLKFQSLLAFNIAQGPQGAWDSTSMYYIGQMVAAMNSTFLNSSRQRP